MHVNHIYYPFNQVGDAPLAPSVIAIGDFDGVHIGHRQVFYQARMLADRLHCPAAVMTFHPHPREVLGKEGYSEYLTPLEEKLQQAAYLGMDAAYVVHFDRKLAMVAPVDFVEEILIPLQIKGIVAGFNFTFGHKARGTAADLLKYSRDRFAVEIVNPVHCHGEKVSSTLIREYIHQGDVTTARQLLGRPHRINGIVMHGQARGRTLGFPTANLQLTASYVLPCTGVYVVDVAWRNQTYPGVMNIGYNPTFYEETPQLSPEVYLLDVSPDLYGESLSVNFLQFIRPEKQFASVEDLIAEMHHDVKYARTWLKENKVYD